MQAFDNLVEEQHHASSGSKDPVHHQMKLLPQEKN